jgi:ribonuclease P protein component
MDFARESRRAQDVQSSSAAAQRVGNTSQLASLRSKAVPFETGRFRRADRILCTRDFGRAVKSGKRGASKNFVVVIAPRADGDARETDEIRSRLGVTVSKRVGNSVIRNRVKRRIREWFRHAREGLPTRSDIVVIARRTARDLSGSEVALALDEVIHGARVGRGGRKMAECR